MSGIIRLGESRPTARKPHRCSMCHRLIGVGETYEAVRNVYDGRAYTWKTCAHCEAAAEVTSLGDYLYECAAFDDDGYGPDSVAEWEPRTRRECVVKAQWERGWRYYGGQPARLRYPDFQNHDSNRLRPDDSCPLVPVPRADR